MGEKTHLSSSVGPRDSKASVGRRATPRQQLRIRPAHRYPQVFGTSDNYAAFAMVIHWLMVLRATIVIGPPVPGALSNVPLAKAGWRSSFAFQWIRSRKKRGHWPLLTEFVGVYRLLIYIVISKPNRTSLYAGVSQAMSVSFPSGQLKSIQIEAISMPARSQFTIFTDNIYISMS